MTKVLLVGQDHNSIDFSDPKFPEGFAKDVLNKTVDDGIKMMTDKGWEATPLFLPSEQTKAVNIIKNKINADGPYDCVVLGGGMRIDNVGIRTFESIINAVHESAPQSKIGFNNTPEETLDIVNNLLSLK